MNKEEKELDDLVNEIEKTDVSVPPFFELYVTIFSISMAILFFVYPNFVDNYSANLYERMLAIMPQFGWAFSYFIGCMLLSIGLLSGHKVLRTMGLILNAILSILMTVCYAMDFPSIGTLNFGCMAIFSIVSIPFVKHTGIKTKEE